MRKMLNTLFVTTEDAYLSLEISIHAPRTGSDSAK